MEQATINFHIDSEIKKGMETACKNMGMNMTTAFTIFATKVSREQRIPFEVSVDAFYSEENMKRLKSAISDIEAGINVSEHEIIEVEDD